MTCVRLLRGIARQRPGGLCRLVTACGIHVGKGGTSAQRLNQRDVVLQPRQRGILLGQRGAYDGPFALPLSPEVHLLSIHVAPERDAAGQDRKSVV